MRTTLDINDDLLRQAKHRAAETSRTLTSVVEDALRLALGAQKNTVHKHSVKIPTSGSGGLQPGVDLDDTAALQDRMDGRA